jgi:hypothetical protein
MVRIHLTNYLMKQRAREYGVYSPYGEKLGTVEHGKRGWTVKVGEPPWQIVDTLGHAKGLLGIGMRPAVIQTPMHTCQERGNTPCKSCETGGDAVHCWRRLAR